MAYRYPSNWKDQGVVYPSISTYCKLHPVPIRAVRVEEGFWKPRIEANRCRGIPRLLEFLEEHGVVDNFRRISGRREVRRRGPLFTDSDLYKWMEGVAFALQSQEDPKLGDALDYIIEDVLSAQGEDGYLNTYFVEERAGERFQRLETDHEFYCCGHLIQAAVAYYRATGRTELLEGARRFADYLTEVFGPDKRQGKSGHPELEMAMVELYRTTEDRKYLDFAGFLLDQLRFTSLSGMEGHAVRAAYACCGAADYYAESGDRAYREALERLWEDMVKGKIYITGGIGARHDGEAFGESYELPNFRAYAETCAAIANIMWNWRMLLIEGEARFADLMETILYNGFLSGVSLDGTRYFYVNPLASSSGTERRGWYDCTCCPTNVVRMMASLAGYFYSTSPEGIWIHLYDNSRLDWHLQGGQDISILQKTRYPWEGDIEITVNPGTRAHFALFLRIPGWCREAKVRVEGKGVLTPQPGSYLKLERTWSPGDVVHLEFPMPVTLIEAHPRLRENLGSLALRRGPIVYCIEGVDNPGIPVLDVQMLVDPKSPERTIAYEFQPGLLGGVTVLRARALMPVNQSRKPLYRPLRERKPEPRREVQITLIPYYAWANRGPSPMQVWIPWMER